MKRIYFASDFHLGAPDDAHSLLREKKIIRWLDSIASDAEAIYLVGDLFDFWFEYRYTVPKGHVRFLGKLAELSDRGIEIHFFTGNHDMWMFDYFEKELGVKMHRKPVQFERNGHRFFIGHGDGLGPGDYGYKFIKIIFASKICQWLFARLHPNFSFAIANFWSKRSRKLNGSSDEIFLGEDQEWLAIYAKDILNREQYDYFIFGHRHLPLEIQLSSSSKYINLGAWFKDCTYACYDGEKLSLQRWEKSE